MDPTTRRALIDRYAAGPAEVDAALAGLTDADLDTRPADGSWSPREIAHHLADSELTSAIRLRRLLAEDAPAIDGYDEEEFARRLHYDRPIATSLAAFAAARASCLTLLERLAPDDWTRAGTHSQSGPYAVDDWLRIYAAHAHDHADQIRRARQGRP